MMPMKNSLTIAKTQTFFSSKKKLTTNIDERIYCMLMQQQNRTNWIMCAWKCLWIFNIGWQPTVRDRFVFVVVVVRAAMFFFSKSNSMYTDTTTWTAHIPFNACFNEKANDVKFCVSDKVRWSQMKRRWIKRNMTMKRKKRKCERLHTNTFAGLLPPLYSFAIAFVAWIFPLPKKKHFVSFFFFFTLPSTLCACSHYPHRNGLNKATVYYLNVM